MNRKLKILIINESYSNGALCALKPNFITHPPPSHKSSPQTSVVWMVGPPTRSGYLTILWSVVVSQHMGQLQFCLSHREWKELCFPSGQDIYIREINTERQTDRISDKVPLIYLSYNSCTTLICEVFNRYLHILPRHTIHAAHQNGSSRSYIELHVKSCDEKAVICHSFLPLKLWWSRRRWSKFGGYPLHM